MLLKLASSSRLNYLWSGDLFKSLSQLIMSILLFSQYFFSIDFARWKSVELLNIPYCDSLKIYWRFSMIFKTSINVFWYIKDKHSEGFIQYTIHWNKTQIIITKNALFFLLRAPIHQVLLLIRDSYMSWSTRFISLKGYVGFSIFDLLSFLLKFIDKETTATIWQPE